MSYIDFEKNNSCLLTIDFQNDFVYQNGSPIFRDPMILSNILLLLHQFID